MFLQLNRYKAISPQIKNFILASFFIQLNNSVYFLIANIYMSKAGFSDTEIASFVTSRFLLVMLFAFPFGMFIKTQRLKPFYFITAATLPILTFAMVYGVDIYNANVVRIVLTLFGMCFMMIAVSALPFILRNAAKETHTEAIALNFATWSLGLIFCGVVTFMLTNVFPQYFTERRLFQFFALLSLFSIYFLFKIGEEKIPDKSAVSGFVFSQYDWKLILKCVFPTLIIAVGAGFTIPFINLFFFHVFGVDSDVFALMGSFSALLVSLVTIIVPSIKLRFGYNAITFSQSLAVLALFLLATTEYFSAYGFVVFVAAFLYLIRQPLMSLAGPLTSEMTMYYVGKNNQEMLAALNSAIWSSSWLFSSIMFGVLRQQQFKFSSIFYITACLYVVGVTVYWLLIKDFYRKEKKGLIE